MVAKVEREIYRSAELLAMRRQIGAIVSLTTFTYSFCYNLVKTQSGLPKLSFRERGGAAENCRSLDWFPKSLKCDPNSATETDGRMTDDWQRRGEERRGNSRIEGGARPDAD